MVVPHLWRRRLVEPDDRFFDQVSHLGVEVVKVDEAQAVGPVEAKDGQLRVVALAVLCQGEEQCVGSALNTKTNKI